MRMTTFGVHVFLLQQGIGHQSGPKQSCPLCSLCAAVPKQGGVKSCVRVPLISYPSPTLDMVRKQQSKRDSYMF